VLAFAHRGGTGDFPENTLPAFQHSIDLGYRYLETDIHLSADDVLYAFHDASLKRSTGVDALIGDMGAAVIDQLLVDGVAAIPRLDDVLSMWPRARVNIDTKSDASVMPLIATLRAHRAIDRVCVGSFNDRRIKLCRRELGPELCTSMGQAEVMRLVLASRGVADPALLRGACAQIPTHYGVPIATQAVIDLAHDLDIQVHVWTIDQATQMESLLDDGVDGIMSDEPRILRDVLINRGAWAPGH